MPYDADAPFRQYSITEDQSFADGKATGQTWTLNYVPGGPYVAGCSYDRDPEWVAYCAKTRANNAAWLRGFHEGLAARSEAK